jgi:hypothetical protein
LAKEGLSSEALANLPSEALAKEGLPSEALANLPSEALAKEGLPSEALANLPSVALAKEALSSEALARSAWRLTGISNHIEPGTIEINSRENVGYYFYHPVTG